MLSDDTIEYPQKDTECVSPTDSIPIQNPKDKLSKETILGLIDLAEVLKPIYERMKEKGIQINKNKT